MKKFWISIAVALSVILSVAMPVMADEPSTDIILDGGYVGKVVGRTWDGQAIYQTDFSAPEYLPDKVTRIDTSWKVKPDGSFESGANLLSAYVSGEFVSVSDKGYNSIFWQPALTVDKVDTKLDKSGIAEGKVSVKTHARILAVDPMNDNYTNNTIEWDYGSGVFRRVRLIEGMFQEFYVITQPIAGDFTISNTVTQSDNFTGKVGKVVAWDADNKAVDLTVDNSTIKLTKGTALDTKVKYPITIDPDLTFTTSASDGEMYSFNAVYATARANATGTVSSGAIESDVGQGHFLADYFLWRLAVYFNTASLSGLTIASANLTLRGYADYSTTDFSITIQNGQPTYPHDPLVAADYNRANFTGTGGAFNTAGFSTSGYNAIPLNATGLSWLNTTGTTKLYLISSRDIAGTQPGAAPAYEYVSVYMYEQGVGYRPQLIVTYTADAPGIVATAASSVAYTTARMNSSLTDDGGDNVSVRWGYGDNSITAANFTAYDNVTAWSGYIYQTSDTPYFDLTGLTGSHTYYYRVQAINSGGNTTSANEITFTTQTSVGNIANFYGNPSSTSIKLNWVFGAGDSNAMVRFRPDTFPTDNTSGTLVYFGPLTSYAHSGLSEGTTYFYWISGESGGAYSSGNLTMAMTTTMAPSGGGTLPAAPNPGGWNQEPDSSGLANLEGFYTVGSAVFTSLGINVNRGWEYAWMMFAALLGIIILIISKKLFVSALTTMGMILVGVVLGIESLYPLAIMVAVSLGAYAVENKT